MTAIASALAAAAGSLQAGVVEAARQVLARVVLPSRIDGSVADRYIRKAMRSGAWRLLKPEARALLLALRRWGPVRSPTLRSIVEGILLEIELRTVRGRAIFYGALISLKRLGLALSEALGSVRRLLCLGISYLNSPPMYRFYG